VLLVVKAALNARELDDDFIGFTGIRSVVKPYLDTVGQRFGDDAKLPTV